VILRESSAVFQAKLISQYRGYRTYEVIALRKAMTTVEAL
jgi:hypothetical protein